ncbi:MAG: FliM/FliN family flagellar motor switch protein [Balneolaceae bacterium]|nr:FliM/FliN family flagellar motor switch protein [Balneolaceae bacterium]MCH8547911.1 FliM/FliN family flagellar motor switch protein [Balneolaceae bacterium]
MQPQPTKARLGKRKFVEPYDFRQPKLFSKEIMRTLRTLHDVLARNLSRVFSSTLRQKVDVSLQKLDQISSSEFIHKLESPNVIYMLSVKELGGELIAVIPPALCIHTIERQSGGRGDEMSDRRTLTTIEEKIISRVMKNINSEIVIAWEPYLDISINEYTYESKPENVHVASVDPTIVANFEIDLGKHKSFIQISYPYSLLKKAMNDTAMKRGNQAKTEKLSDEQMQLYKHTLSNAGVLIRPLLGTTKLSVDEISGLEEGDVITLNQRTDKPLEVRVNGVKKMTAYPGLIQGRRAVKIFELIEEINEQELI